MLLNVPARRGFDWRKDAAIGKAVKACEEGLGETGRVLLRASGTEPLFRVMVEGKEGKKVTAMAKKLAQLVARRAA